MTEEEIVKKAIKESYGESLVEAPNISDDDLPPAVRAVKDGIEARIEAEAIGVEFLEKLQPIVESRRKLKEAEDGMAQLLIEMRGMFDRWGAKFDSLSELKRENIQLEREVLTKIKAQL